MGCRASAADPEDTAKALKTVQGPHGEGSGFVAFAVVPKAAMVTQGTGFGTMKGEFHKGRIQFPGEFKSMIKRREFLGVASVAGVGSALGAVPAGGSGPNGFREPVRELPVSSDCDLIVAGGGPAGVAAAVTAARAGRKVRLFEAHGALGGIWTTGLLSCIIDFGRADFAKELIARLDRAGARTPRRKEMTDANFIYDPERMKLELESMCTEAGVEFHYHSFVAAAHRDAAGRRLSAVVTESKCGRKAWRAKAYLDCTGDGDLAAHAGCGFDTGGVRPGDPDQPASLIALLTLDDDSSIGRFVVNAPEVFSPTGKTLFNAKKELYAEFARVGLEPSYADPTLFRIADRLYAFMGNHEYGVRPFDDEAVTAATVRARKEIFAMTDALALKGGAAWKGLRVVATAEQIGHRMARRIHGRYRITVEDALAGRRFPDAIAECRFGIDVHGVSRAANRVLAAGAPNGMRIKPYQIPFRACASADLDNLYMAGRCISGDFLSQASYRVTGPAVEMGEGVVRKLVSDRLI